MTRCRGVSHRVTGSALQLLRITYDFVQLQTVVPYRRALNMFKLSCIADNRRSYIVGSRTILQKSHCVTPALVAYLTTNISCNPLPLALVRQWCVASRREACPCNVQPGRLR